MDKTSPFTRQELQFLLIEQRKVLREIVTNTYTRACTDGKISTDEMGIYRTLLHKVDEITAKKINLFMDLDLTTKESHLLSYHPKIGKIFSDLTATLIMDIFSEETNISDLESRTQLINSLLKKLTINSCQDLN